MKFAFIVPPPQYNRMNNPIDRVYGCNYGYDYKPPIHMLSAATVLEREGHAIRFLDCPAEGWDAARFEAWAREGDFDAAVFFTPYLAEEEDKRAAAEIRKHHGLSKPVIYLGAAPTWKPENFVSDEATLVVRGEPEMSLIELAQALEGQGDLSAVEGIALLRDGTPHLTPTRGLLDIEWLPIPNRRLLLGEYRVNRLDVTPVTTMCVSRGCQYKCTFCAPNAVDQASEVEHKRVQGSPLPKLPLRLRTSEQVIEEFREIHALGYRGIEVADNQFVWSKRRTLEICEGIRDLGLKWMCLARANHLRDPKVVRALGEAGCMMVYIGTESFCQAILDDICKGIQVEDVKTAVAVCRECGVEPEVSVMIGGSALETRETIRHSMREAKKLGTPFVHYSAVLPFPNCQFYDQAMEKGWMRHGEFEPVDNAKTSIVNLPHVSAEEMERILRWAYLRQYLSPRGIWHQVRKVRSPADVWYKMKMALKLIRNSFFTRWSEPSR
ncbi:radical SAM protein [Candidatus Sumerlaeota bacterium]|nr:radical SAM protein [Candidatus Sumerlaeota bacterium]